MPLFFWIRRPFKETHMLGWLTTVLARLTRRGPAGPPPRLNWNGRSWVEAGPPQPDPDTDYGTLNRPARTSAPEPTRTPERPAG
jgi:hypothetical protein